mmetsp:Transcript_6497/g.19215  ORF Transcript_6497/g.19215 Transcript_6497/m.19215 type:complete len:299 (-) Transcript_6497:129-1025(-)
MPSGAWWSPPCEGTVPLLGMGASSGILVWEQSGIGAFWHLCPLILVPPQDVPIFGSEEKLTLPPCSFAGRPCGMHPLSWGLSSTSTSSSWGRFPQALGMVPVKSFSSKSISIRLVMHATHSGSSPNMLFESRSISCRLGKYLRCSGKGPSSPLSGRWKLVIFLHGPLADFWPDQRLQPSSITQSPLHSRPSQLPWYPCDPQGSSAQWGQLSPPPYQLFRAEPHLAERFTFASRNMIAARMSSSHVGAYWSQAAVRPTSPHALNTSIVARGLLSRGAIFSSSSSRQCLLLLLLLLLLFA